MAKDVNEYDIEVQLTLPSAMEGGLRVGIASGYRGGHFYLDDIDWIARFDVADRNVLGPGETGRVYVTFFFDPQYLAGHLQVGRGFLLSEVGRTIGKGTIARLLGFDQHVKRVLREELRGDE